MWQLLMNQIKIGFVGIDEDICLRKYPWKAVVSLLKLCTSYAKKVNELLRKMLSTAWPESTSFTTCKNNTVEVG